MKTLANYLGVESSDNQYRELVNVTSFENMKARVDIPRLKVFQGMEFFRKGTIGDWKNFFTEEMSLKCDEIVAEKLNNKRKITYEPRGVVDQTKTN
jgi:hypothetical protein